MKFDDNQDFIQKVIKEIDDFLTKQIFSRDMACLSEQKKPLFLSLQGLFGIVNEHLPLIQKSDPGLAKNLKIKFANLPHADGITRSNFSNLYLTEKEQVSILVAHFQEKEDKIVDSAIKEIQAQELCPGELERIAKLVDENRSHLSKKNLLKFQKAVEAKMHEEALKKKMGAKVAKNWNAKKEDILDSLKNYFTCKFWSQNEGMDDDGRGNYRAPKEVTALYRAAKAKSFFEKQARLDESQIRIPYWYHATRIDYMCSIIETEVRVEHRQAFPGAWVSTQRQPNFGHYTLAVKHNVIKIDLKQTDPKKKVLVGYEYDKYRWRGLQEAIPMRDAQQSSHLVLVAVPGGLTYKDDKNKFKDHLKTHRFTDVKVIQNEQLDFIQREMMSAIGTPNLSGNWWGDVDARNRPR